jgi:hypothetical protein
VDTALLHSIVLWDCAFREFFHTLDSLATQTVDRNSYEVLVVEQRSKDLSESRIHELGLRSLQDRAKELESRVNLRVIYLEQPVTTPYHLGRAVNAGLAECEGDIISVMDGDLLLPQHFLASLSNFHSTSPGSVANLFRRMAERPAGVPKSDWTNQDFEFERVLEECADRNDGIPSTVSNKGPLISAERGIWEVVGGYDEHLIWSTGLSRLGQDVNTRMEVCTNRPSSTLDDCFAVHPWHPMGFTRSSLRSSKLLGLQQGLIEWSRKNQYPGWRERLPVAETVYQRNKSFVDAMITSHLADPGAATGDAPEAGLLGLMEVLSRHLERLVVKILNKATPKFRKGSE